MAKEFEVEDGKMETFYSAEEIEAAKKAEADRVAAEKDTEIERLKKISAEKTDNFRKYNEMTEEEKKAHSENEIIQIRRNDKLEEELAGVKKVLTEKEERERIYTKDTIMKSIHGDKDDIKKSLEENYAILAGMPETTPDEIRARTMKAANLAGISIESINPLYQPMNGDAPVHKQKDDYVETEAGKTAADLVRQNLNIQQPK